MIETPLAPQSREWLEERNQDMDEPDLEAGCHVANLHLPMPVLPDADMRLAPYDRLMQLMFVMLVLAARGEVD